MTELKKIERKGFKNKFTDVFLSFRNKDKQFNDFIEEAFHKHEVYVIGGFVRDIANDMEPRDVDIMIDASNRELENLITTKFSEYKKNKFGGYKIHCKDFDFDCWTTESNWAFKNNLIGKSKSHHSISHIASGGYFNFDSIAINAQTLRLHAKYYNECISDNKLDFVRKNFHYLNDNPVPIDNVRRAIYLCKKYHLEPSDDLRKYILEKTQCPEFEEIGKTKHDRYTNDLPKKKLVRLIRRVEQGKPINSTAMLALKMQISRIKKFIEISFYKGNVILLIVLAIVLCLISQSSLQIL